jgi:hypothetical protein
MNKFMKKILATTFLFGSMIANTFAFDFGAAITTFFGINKQAEIKEIKIDTKTELNTAAKESVTTEKRSSATTTETKKSPAICDEAATLDQKAEKIKSNIKNQIADREKIILSLQKVASSTEIKNVKAVQAKIAEVKLRVNTTIGLETDLLSEIEDARDTACKPPAKKVTPAVAPRIMMMSAMSASDTTPDTEATTSEEKEELDIKSKEDQISKELRDVKSFIKVDLRAFLESL